MTNQKKLPYNTIPLYIAADYRKGELNINQLRLLLWLRAIGTPYGIATASLVDLKDDVFPDIDLKINTINSYLLKLRQKQHIYFEPRQGKTGTFDIQLNHWLTPNKGYKTLDKFFSKPRRWTTAEGEIALEDSYPQAESSEASQKFEGQNQKLQEAKSGLINKFSVDSESRQIRSYHTNTETHKHLSADESSTASKGIRQFRKVATHGFVPKNDVEERCWRIALEVEDPNMNFILSVLNDKDGGIEVVEEGYESYLAACAEYKRKGEPVKNPACLFNSCATVALEGRRHDKKLEE
jgi:hypothetical protein